MHASWFSYPITRPYPFRWFTPVALIGGVVLAVIFSLVNLSSNGFYLKTIYTTDPNSTVAAANDRWWHKRPFNWQNEMVAECQPYLLSVGNSFFTSSLGFRYEIKGISSIPNGTGQPTSLSSVGYMNSTLQDCRASRMELNLIKADSSKPPSWWISWLASDVASTLDCTVISDAGPVTLTVGVEYVGSGDHVYDYVIEDNYKTHASVWWGTRLLNAYWSGVLTAASQITMSKTSLVRGALVYTGNRTKTDIRSDDFFDLYWWYNNADSTTVHRGMVSNDDYNTDSWFGSPAITEGLHFAKLLHSLFALDLGSCNLPNLLLDEDSLNYAILAPDDMNRKQGGLLNDSDTLAGLDSVRFDQIPTPGLPKGSGEGLIRLSKSYDKFRPMTGDLTCKNATIVSQYVCSVPQQKSTGVMLWAIILANLVFLQAAWRLLTWTSVAMVARKDPQAMVCEACLYARGKGSVDEDPKLEPSSKYMRLESD